MEHPVIWPMLNKHSVGPCLCPVSANFRQFLSMVLQSNSFSLLLQPTSYSGEKTEKIIESMIFPMSHFFKDYFQNIDKMLCTLFIHVWNIVKHIFLCMLGIIITVLICLLYSPLFVRGHFKKAIHISCIKILLNNLKIYELHFFLSFIKFCFL